MALFTAGLASLSKQKLYRGDAWLGTVCPCCFQISSVKMVVLKHSYMQNYRKLTLTHHCMHSSAALVRAV